MPHPLLRLATAPLLMSIALCASAGEGNFSYKDLTISGVMQEVPGPSARCPSGVGGSIAGFGDSALLGRVVVLTSDCFSQSGATFSFGAGHMIITTMTGDLLFADYSGQALPTGVGTNLAFNSASFQVTGGTGKYAKASGGGSITGTEDGATGKGTIQLSGRIFSRD